MLAFVLGPLLFYNHCGGWAVSTPFKLFWPLWEGVMWAAFVCYLAVAPLLPHRLSRLLAHLGSISYSLYLCLSW